MSFELDCSNQVSLKHNQNVYVTMKVVSTYVHLMPLSRHEFPKCWWCMNKNLYLPQLLKYRHKCIIL